MKMSELILEIGDENVIFQNLDTCMTSGKYTARSGSKITFGTEQRLHPTLGTEMLGLVIWLPRDKVAAALEKGKNNG